MGEADSLCITGVIILSLVKRSSSFSTISFKEEGTGRAFLKTGLASFLRVNLL